MLANRSISATTRYCAVYGFPVRHSASPAMQNAGLRALGLDWRYLAFEVRPTELEEAIAGAKAIKFVGLNLTVPHKLLAVELVDELDDSARRWEAVNTIQFLGQLENGDLKPLAFCEAAEVRAVRSRGYNTDAEALLTALREDLAFEPSGATVLLLGAGGAGRGAAMRLAAAGLKTLFLLNRTASKADALKKELQTRYPDVEVQLGYPNAAVDLLLNATSAGLKPTDPLPLEPARFPIARAKAVYDMIYRPKETGLLKMAQAAGCRAAHGAGMLLHQGARALEIWSGQTAPLGAMREALAKEIVRDESQSEEGK